MSDVEQPKRLRLREALIEWCDPELVAAVLRTERLIPAAQGKMGGRIHLCPPGEIRKPLGADDKIDWVDERQYYDAWHALEADFVRRVEEGELHLTGVELAPELTTEPRAIPGVWASSCQFFFGSSRLHVRRPKVYLHFGAVTVSRQPPDGGAALVQAPSQRLPARIMPENVATLSDDLILRLLEEHADRVLRSPDAQLIEPGRISLLPIIKRKLLMRAEQGETRETWKAEAQWLASWIESKVRSHHVPVASTIERSLRGYYSPPNRRSKPDFQ